MRTSISGSDLPLHPVVHEERLHQVGGLRLEIWHEGDPLVQQVEEVVDGHGRHRPRPGDHVGHIPRRHDVPEQQVKARVGWIQNILNMLEKQKNQQLTNAQSLLQCLEEPHRILAELGDIVPQRRNGRRPDDKQKCKNN